MLLSVLETSGEQTLLKAIYSANDISWHSPALYLSVQLTKQQTIWFSAPGRALCLSTKRIKKNPQTAVKLFIVNSSPFFWKARDVNKWPVWTHCFSNFPLIFLLYDWLSIHTRSAWGYYSHQLSKIKILLFIFYFFFCFLFSAYSEEVGFMEPLGSVEEITTSPASFPGDSKSMQVKIVPTNKSPAGTPARTKGKGKWKMNYTFSKSENSTITAHSDLSSQHFSRICRMK